jgi:hypothetical protein
MMKLKLTKQTRIFGNFIFKSVQKFIFFRLKIILKQARDLTEFFFFLLLAEVSSARNRFSGALNIAERIVDKFAGDDFPSSPLKRLQGLDSPFPSPTKSPRGVRRRRKKPVPLNTAFHHTFVMKLFDRSVDLAQFPHDTSLYPVCR